MNLPHQRPLVRMIDVARRAKCSQAAVSHALSGTGVGQIRLRPERIEEIRRIAQEMGYQPNQAARQLTGKRSHVIGVLVETLLTATHTRIFAWLQHFASQHGLHVLVVQTNNDTQRVEQTLREFQGRGVEGLIYVAYLNDEYWPDAGEILASWPGVVSVLGRPQIENGYYIDVDVADGARQSVMHLAGRGRRRITLLLDDLQRCWNQHRRDGFVEAHRHLDRDVDASQIHVLSEQIDWGQSGADGRVDRLIGALLEQQTDAVITDDTTAGLLTHGFARRGLRVPEDMALVGHCNDVIVHYTTPRLTTVDIQIRQVMDRAVRMLAGTIEGPDAGHIGSEILEPELLVREST